MKEIPGKSRENIGAIFPESRHALHSRNSGTGKGKPATNFGYTAPHLVPTFCARCFFGNRQLQPSRVFLTDTWNAKLQNKGAQVRAPESRNCTQFQLSAQEALHRPFLQRRRHFNRKSSQQRRGRENRAPAKFQDLGIEMSLATPGCDCKGIHSRSRKPLCYDCGASRFTTP